MGTCFRPVGTELVDNPRVIYLTPGSGNGDRKIRLPNLMNSEKQCGGDVITGTHFPGRCEDRCSPVDSRAGKNYTL